jgi:hypothetical protein
VITNNDHYLRHLNLQPTLAQRLIMTASLVFALPCHAADVPTSIGFRGDGSGVFSDAKPPTEFDAITGKNLAWKVPLPNFSSSSPIVIGRKVLVTCTGGWPEGQDCATLRCYDADTGKELWARDLDEFGGMPADRAQEARKLRTEYWQQIRLLNRRIYEYQTADPARKEEILKEVKPLGANIGKFDNYKDTYSAEVMVMRGPLGKKLAEVCGYQPIGWSPMCLDLVMPTPVSDGRRVIVHNGRRAVHCFDLDGKELWNTWQSDVSVIYNFCDLATSPTIVGDLVLMCFDKHLWAYDTATGKQRWKTSIEEGPRHGMGQSIRLDLPAGPGRTETALYLWQGDLVRVRDGVALCRGVAPFRMSGAAGNEVDTVFLDTHWRTDSVPFAANLKGSDGKPVEGTLALRFVLDGDTAKPELLWFHDQQGKATDRKLGKYAKGYKVLDHFPIFHEGRLLQRNGAVIDVKTGKPWKPHPVGTISEHGLILANGHLYGVPGDPVNAGSGGASGLGTHRDLTMTVGVAKVEPDGVAAIRQMPLELLPATHTEPAKKAQVVAMTGRDRHQKWYGWSGGYNCPFASGNRLFIRTYNYLYCFGEKDKPFVPSQAFAERKP